MVCGHMRERVIEINFKSLNSMLRLTLVTMVMLIYSLSERPLLFPNITEGSRVSRRGENVSFLLKNYSVTSRPRLDPA